MGSLKRKEGPGGSSTPKSAKPTTDARPSKRAKASGDSKKDATKKESKPASAAVSSLIREEEPMFPRGGASVLTPLEQKEIKIQAKKDVLFEEATGKQKGGDKEGKKKRKSKHKEGDKKASKDEDSVKIESLNFKRLVKGSLVLGTVSAISPLNIAIALPNNLTGHVSITAVSETLTKKLEASAQKEDAEESNDDDDDDDDENDVDLASMFRLGQYVRAYVVSTMDESALGKPRRHIELSLMPAHANSGMTEQDVVENCTLMASVVSVEDHGFVMDVGISDSKVNGFLPRKQLDKSIPEEAVQPGCVLFCVATGKAANGKVVQLSTLEDRLGSTKYHPSEATTIDSYLPGTAADILVSEVSQHGIVGKLMGSLDVTADLVHSGAGPDGVDLEDKYKVGSRLKARIICTFPAAKHPKLGISILPHVLSLKPKMAIKDGREALPVDILAHSAIVEKCTVQRVEPEIGLYVDVGVEGVPGFVHISRVKDGKVDSLFENSGPYKVGSVHPGRVVGYNSFDGMFLLSMEKSILEQLFLRIEDIPVGAVIPGVVEKLVVNQAGLGGVIVKISEGISGLVPEMHLADVHLQHPEKKFKEGMKVKTRVLSTNPAKHQVRLTLKKTLVNSDALPVKSHEDLAVGLQAYGTIINILEKGAIVQFYDRLRGFLPVSEMSEAYIHDPKDHFRVGQTVSVYVLSFDPEEHRMIISCKDPSAFGLEKQLALKKLQIGDLVSAKVTQKTEDDIFVELDEGSLKAILPVMHLTDKSVSKTLSALKKIHVNQSLTELVVLEKNESRRSITISHKPSLVQASKEGKLLSNVNNAQVGDVVPGFIRSTTATAAFVQFAGKLVALLPKSKIPREDQDKPGFGFHKTQSVLVKIINVDRDLGRLVVAIPSTVREEANEPSKQAESAIVNALDESIKSLEDLAIGKLTKARVKSAKETQINVDIADNIQGRIDVSQVFDTWEGIKDPKKPLKSFKTNDIIQVRVLGVHDARNHTYLPITHRSTHSVLELTAKPSDLKEDAAPAGLSYSKLEQGSSYLAFVNNVAPTHIWVNLSPNVRGRINATELSHDLSKLVDISKSFPVGSALKVRVISVDAEKKRLDLSALTPGSENQMSWDKIKRGMVLPGRVTKVDDRQVFVKLSDTLAAPVALVDLSDDYDEANPLKYTKHDIVRVAIVDIDKSNKKLRLSMRPSRVLSSASPVTDKEITKNTKVEVGDIVRGFVKNVADKGLFVALGGDVVAMVKIKNLSDSYLKDWKEHYQVGQLVKGRIISVADGRLEMSLKPSVVDKDWVPLLTISDLKEGQVITGKVRKVEEFGAFIDIDGSDNLSGLCHRSEMADRSVNDAKTLYNEGDVVKARVIKVDVKAKRVSLGLKPSYFKDGDDDEMDVDSDDAGAALNDDDDSDADSDEEMSDAGGAIVITGTDAAGDDSDEDEDVEMTEVQEGIKGLETGGFDWNGDALDADDKTTADDTVAPSKKKRREPQIQVDKTAQLDVNGPQTIDDYERLLLGEPNSSALWVAYMAFKMQTSDLSSAREVAKRAIKTINIKEETEKLNVWIAYLNLEVAYGTDETVEEVFKEACTYNDAQEVHERLASIYIQSGKFKEAEDIFEKVVKKYGSKSTDVWINYAHFLHAKANNPERARALIKRATQSLGTATHINLALLPKFAALEFRSPNGDRETGRTLFTQLLAAYPKKFDLWNQFMDLETSSDPVDPAQVRDLFESGSKAKGLKAKQAKSWFRRWAKWEEENGDKKSRERVSAKAQEWARTAEERKKSAAAAEEEGYEDDEE